jgi:hypothetical protein
MKQFWVCSIDGWQQVDGQLVDLGISEYDFFLHESLPGSTRPAFAVTEVFSGMAVAFGSTEAKAVQAAKAAIDGRLARLTQAVQAAVERQGASPDHGGVAQRTFKPGDIVMHDRVMAIERGEVYEENGVLLVRTRHTWREQLAAGWTLAAGSVELERRRFQHDAH